MGVAPGYQAGRGLKQEVPAPANPTLQSSARLSSRARIETVAGSLFTHRCFSSARLSSRARIETCSLGGRVARVTVAPGYQAGRGLKQAANRSGGRGGSKVAPGYQAGRGLKQVSNYLSSPENRVAPGYQAGRGLKPGECHLSIRYEGSARLSSRARIETRNGPAAVYARLGSARLLSRARIETSTGRLVPRDGRRSARLLSRARIETRNGPACPAGRRRVAPGY